MNSPFAIFRKHANILIVALLGLAMFAFIVMDNLQTHQVPYVVATIIGGTLFFWASKGKNYNQRILYTAIGCVAAPVITFFAISRGQVDNSLATNLGTLSEQQQRELFDSHRLANNFMATVQMEALEQPNLPPQRLYPFQYDIENPQRDPILGYLLSDYADTMNIVVTDQVIGDFLNNMTDNKLTQEMFTEACDRLGVSGTKAYKAIRPQLKALLVLHHLTPTAMGTPEVFWESYEKTGITEELQVIPVKTEEFVSLVDDIDEAEVKKMFEAFKMNAPGQLGPGSPGFVVPRKYELQYIKADYLEAEAEIAAVTDEDVEKFYEENKENYRNFRPIPEGTEATSEGPSLDPAAATEQPAEEKGEETEAKPAEEEKPADSAPATEEKSDEQSSRTDLTGSTFASVQDEVEESAEPAAESETKPAEKAETEKAKEAAPEKTEEPKAEKAPETKSEDATEPKAEEPASEEENTPAEEETPEEPQPEFKPLDDDLKEEIRATILRERTTALLDERMKAIEEEFRRLGNEYKILHSQTESELLQKEDLNEEERKTELDKLMATRKTEITQTLKALAEKHKLIYGATDPLSNTELADPDSELKLGIASPVNAFQNNAFPVWSAVFRNQTYSPERVQESGDQYVYWKTRDIASHIPEFSDPGIREEVVKAIKLESAKKKAEERAGEIVDLVKKNEGKIVSAIEGQTVTGKEDGEALSFIDVSPFSWLTEPSAANQNFGAPRNLQLAAVPELENIGNDFMKVIFDEMEVDEIRAVSNADGSFYYVTKVLNRKPDDEEGMDQLHSIFVDQQNRHQALSRFFGPSPYTQALQVQNRELYTDFINSITQSYGVRWNSAAQ